MTALPFLDTNYSPGAIALISADGPTISYEHLVNEANDWSTRVSHSQKQLVFFYAPRCPEAVSCLLGLLNSGHAVALLDPDLKPLARKEIEDLYQPWACVFPDQQKPGKINVTLCESNARDPSSPIYEHVSLLLSTSGSTGSPKFAKLSKSAVLANVLDIASVLKIGSTDRGLAHLDSHYSYGLSIITSHLAAGASLAFPNGKFTDRTFWDEVRQLEATHMPGVPYHYEMISRLGIKRLKIPSVTVLTQAGGRLALNIQKEMHQYMESIGGRFCVMYGQTEAAPRMSTLPHERFLDKIGSVGPALPSGKFSILIDGQPCKPMEVGEVAYQGANVMLGYARNANDLSNGDEHNGLLRTGDLGCLDDEGFLTVKGRSSRMGKVFGWRISMDELEKAVEEFNCAAVIQKDETIFIVHQSDANPDLDAVKTLISERFTLPISVFAFAEVDEIPTTSRDKTDYVALAGLV